MRSCGKPETLSGVRSWPGPSESQRNTLVLPAGGVSFAGDWLRLLPRQSNGVAEVFPADVRVVEVTS